MEERNEVKRKIIAAKFRKLGYEAGSFFKNKQASNPDDKRMAQEILQQPVKNEERISSVEKKDMALATIDSALRVIDEIKQYSSISKDIKLKERIIKDNIINNLIPAKSPANKEYAELAKDMKTFYSPTAGGLKDDQKARYMGLVEFKLNNRLASRGNLRKILDLANSSLKEVKTESKRALDSNALPNKVNALNDFDKRINSSLDKIGVKVKNAAIEKRQKDLLTSLVQFERKLAQAEKESLLREKGLVRTPKPPEDKYQKVDKLISFVKNFPTVRFQRPEEIEKRAKRNTNQLKEQSYQKNSVTILDRTQSSLERDKRINNYEGRTKQREALIEQVVKYSNGIKTDLQKDKNKNNDQKLNKDFLTLNNLVKDVNEEMRKTNYKTKVKNIISENAKKIQFDDTKKTKKRKMGNH
jgi:hypothetical protein